MREMSSTSWLRQGSSIVFDKSKLGPLVDGDCLISLREALTWLNHWPTLWPEDKKTVLVSGLETCLDLMTVQDAEAFISDRIRKLILKFQAEWDQRGLVFGFSTPNKIIHQMSDDQILFKSNNRTIRLSQSLWNGTATSAIARLMSDDRSQSTLGYYVRRVS